MARRSLELSTLLVFLLTGCSKGGQHDLLVDRAARSVLFGSLSSPLSLAASDVGDQTEVLLPFEVGDDDLVAFVYDRPLAELQIPEGTLSSVSGTECAEEGRPLPPARLELFAEPSDRLAWRELGDRPEVVRAFRLPPFDVVACLDAGGCLDAGTCKLACDQTAPEIAPPAELRGRVDLAPRKDCPAQEGHFLGTGDCEPVGRPCGDGPWPRVIPPAAEQWFVLAGAASGSGGFGDPFGTIGEALAVASDGAQIVVGAGTYDEPLAIDRRKITLIGACSAATTLRGGISSESTRLELHDLTLSEEGIEVTAGTALLEGVVLAGPGEVGLRLGPTAIVDARHILVADWATGGIVAAEGELVAEDALFIRDNAAVQCDGGTVRFERAAIISEGRAEESGISASNRCRVQVESVLLEGVGGDAVEAVDGGVVQGSLMAVRRTGAGIRADTGTVTLDRVAVTESGTAVSAADSTILLDDLQLATLAGAGVRVSGGELVMERTEAEELLGPLLDAREAALLIRDLSAVRSSEGLLLDLGDQTGLLERIFLERPGGRGLAGQSGEIVAREVTIRGAAVGVDASVALTLGPARLEENDVGVAVSRCGLDPSLLLQDVYFAGNGERIRRTP